MSVVARGGGHNRYRLPAALTASALLALGNTACSSNSTASHSHPTKATPHPEAATKAHVVKTEAAITAEQAKTVALESLTTSSIKWAHAILDGLDKPGVNSTNYHPGNPDMIGNIATTQGLKPATFVSYEQESKQLVFSALSGSGHDMANPPYTSVYLVFQLGEHNTMQDEVNSPLTTNSFRRALANPTDVHFIAANGEVNDYLARGTDDRALGIALQDGTLYGASGINASLMGTDNPTSFLAIGVEPLTTPSEISGSTAQLEALLSQATAKLSTQFGD